MAEGRIEIREPGLPARPVRVTGVLEIGRECDGELVADRQVSRRHLRLTVTQDGLSATDLSSANGTLLNGVVLSGDGSLSPGDVLRIGRTEVVVLAVPTPPPASTPPERRGDGAEPAREPPPTTAPPPETQPPPASPPRPALGALAAIEADAATVRYRPGSPGAAAAPAMAVAARAARRRLAGLGSEPWGARPQICLVDPFPDPDHPSEVVASGTLLDAAAGEVWMVVTAESPPEPPERPLALLFGAALPAAADLEFLLEGYGIWLSGSADPDAELCQLELPPLEAADGALRGAMAASFVNFLVVRDGEECLRRLLASARPGRLDAAAQELYGNTMSSLEEAWRRRLRHVEPRARTGQLVRLAVRYVQPHLRREVEAFFYMLLGLAFGVVFPFAFRQLLDVDIPSGHYSRVLGLLGVLAIAFVVSLLGSLRQAYLSAYVSASVVRELRTQMFARLQELSAGWFGSHEQGDVLSRLFSDVSALEQGLSRTLRNGIYQLLSLVVSAVVLLVLDPLLGAIVIAGAPLVGLIYRGMGTGARQRSQRVQEETGAMLQVATENYGARQVVQAFALEAREKLRFIRATDRLFRSQLRLQLFGGFFSVSVNMVVTALRLVVLGLGAWLILHRHLTIGGLVAFMSVMGQVLSPVAELTSVGQQLQASSGALGRVEEVLDAPSDVLDTGEAELAPLSGGIELHGVSFGYTPERRILVGIDAKIPAGSKVAFVGPTGAGKSSILQLLMRFWDPSEGSITFDGRDVRQYRLASLRAQIGVVFQETFLFDTTLRENIALGRPTATNDEIEAAAQAAELNELAESLPGGYDTLVGERGGRLSGGQRQRLAIARALLREPSILLLDEATSALDPRTERLIAETIERIGRGRTTVAVTHRLASVVGYDRIFVIVEGKVAEQGTHRELLALGGVYAGLWAEQIGGVVPAEPPFDPAGALGRLALFAGLDAGALAEAARRLRPVELAPGESVPEGGGRLVVVRRGRGRVVLPGLTGAAVASTELASGEAFGLSALLGQPTGASLEAMEPLGLLVLDDEAIAALAARHPSVADALRAGAGGPGPAAGARLTRLPRLTLGPGAPGERPAARASGAAAGPDASTPSGEDVRRASGTYGVIGR